MCLKRVLCLIIVAVIAFTGCQKKKKIEPATSEMPNLETAQMDSGDVFNEFYDDSTVAATAKSSSKKSVKSSTDDDFYSSSSTTEFIPDGRYVVQISCVVSQRLADRLVSECESKGWPAYIAEVTNPTPDLTGTYYRVRIGGFNYLTAARKFAENELVPAGHQYWFDNRSNDNVGMSGYGLGQTGVGEYGGSSGYAPSSSASPAVSEEGSSGTTAGSSSWSGSSGSSWSSTTETATVSTPAAAPAAQPAPEPSAPPAASTTPSTPATKKPASTPTSSSGTSSAPADTASSRKAPTDNWRSGGDWGDDSGW